MGWANDGELNPKDNLCILEKSANHPTGDFVSAGGKLDESGAIRDRDGKSEGHSRAIITPCIRKIVTADSSLPKGLMPEPHEFLLIPNREGTGRTPSDQPGQIESAQTTGGDLPVDDENLGSNEQKVVGTQVTVQKGDRAAFGLMEGLGNDGKKTRDSLEIPLR